MDNYLMPSEWEALLEYLEVWVSEKTSVVTMNFYDHAAGFILSKASYYGNVL